MFSGHCFVLFDTPQTSAAVVSYFRYAGLTKKQRKQAD